MNTSAKELFLLWVFNVSDSLKPLSLGRISLCSSSSAHWHYREDCLRIKHTCVLHPDLPDVCHKLLRFRTKNIKNWLQPKKLLLCPMEVFFWIIDFKGEKKTTNLVCVTVTHLKFRQTTWLLNHTFNANYVLVSAIKWYLSGVTEHSCDGGLSHFI